MIIENNAYSVIRHQSDLSHLNKLVPGKDWHILLQNSIRD